MSKSLACPSPYVYRYIHTCMILFSSCKDMSFLMVMHQLTAIFGKPLRLFVTCNAYIANAHFEVLLWLISVWELSQEHLEKTVQDSSRRHESISDSVAWGGCCIIYLLGQQLQFELFDFSYQFLNVSEVAFMQPVTSSEKSKPPTSNQVRHFQCNGC